MKHKEQIYYIVGAVIILGVLFFGFDIFPSTTKALEKSRALNTQEYDISSFLAEAKAPLSEEDLKYLETLEVQVQHVSEDTAKINVLKQLSGRWFQLQNPIMAGLYAKEIAELEENAMSWAIAGTTFASGLQQALEEKQKLFLRDQAVDAFENAISLEPDAIEHRVNQALCYIELPLANEPMKGVQMLVGLTNNYPESSVPPYQLARLAVQTGQYERGLTRVEQALSLDPSNSRIACLAIDIYTALNKSEEAKALEDICVGQQ